MQKRILVLAVTAAISASAAFAETANVNVYGVANVSVDVVNNGSTSVNKVSSNASRLGFKGAEDLGNGLKAVWQVESLINLDGSGTSTLGTRNTYAGLNSESLGTVLLGRHDTPYKLASRKLDVFADTIADNRSLLGGVSASAATLAAAALPAGGLGATGASAGASFDGRQPDVLAYLSPTINGFTAAAAYVAGAEAVTSSAQTKGSAWSLAGWYDAGPFYGSLAYEVHDYGTTGATATGDLGPVTGALLGDLAGKKESAWKLGASYRAEAFEVNAVYEQTSDNLTKTTNADLFGHKVAYLSGKYNIGSDAVKAAYTRVGNLAGGTGTTKANQLSVGYDHSLSKRTTVYALYTKLSNGDSAKYGLSSASVSTGATAASALDADPSAWSLGLKHTF